MRQSFFRICSGRPGPRRAGRAEGPYKRFSEKNLGAGRIDFARASPIKRVPARPDRVGNGRTVGDRAVTEIDE